MPLSKIVLLQLALFFLSGTYTYAQNSSDDALAIRAVINKQFDTPESKVVIDPVVVKGAYALASWTHAELGGRAVMEKGDNNHWQIALCAGKQINDVAFLAQTGIPSSIAQELSENLQRAEAQLAPEKIKRFDSFNAIIRGAHSSPHSPEHRVKDSPEHEAKNSPEHGVKDSPEHGVKDSPEHGVKDTPHASKAHSNPNIQHSHSTKN